MKVMARHSRADTSTRSPRPERRRAVKALTAPSAPKVPTVHSARPPPTARGHAFVASVTVQRAGQGLEEEVRGLLGATWPAQTEGREAHHHQLGVALAEPAGVDCRRHSAGPVSERRDDDHVGGGRPACRGYRRPRDPPGRSPGTVAMRPGTGRAPHPGLRRCRPNPIPTRSGDDAPPAFRP